MHEPVNYNVYLRKYISVCMYLFITIKCLVFCIKINKIIFSNGRKHFTFVGNTFLKVMFIGCSHTVSAKYFVMKSKIRYSVRISFFFCLSVVTENSVGGQILHVNLCKLSLEFKVNYLILLRLESEKCWRELASNTPYICKYSTHTHTHIYTYANFYDV